MVIIDFTEAAKLTLTEDLELNNLRVTLPKIPREDIESMVLSAARQIMVDQKIKAQLIKNLI